MAAFTNWSGNHTFTPAEIHRPATLDELQGIVAKAPKIRAIGTRHCFNDIADSAELVSVEGLPGGLEIDRSAMTASVNGAVRYGELALELEANGLALHNMASLPHVSVAGATATGTHGSGDRNGNLSTAVAALEIVTASGDVARIKRGDPDFDGMVVNIGALGVVTRVTLDVQPSYRMCQQVFEHLAWDTLFGKFDAVFSAADSVSLFLNYGAYINQVWLKSRVSEAEEAPLREEFLGAKVAKKALHPVGDLDPNACTEQLGVVGPWLNRLPHFNLDAVPASGNELQTEYMIPRRNAVSALRVLRAYSNEIKALLWAAEIRTVAADELWLSSAYGVDTVCLHFSWKSNWEPVKALLPKLEMALAPFNARPHWGKLFLATADEIAPRYERMGDFKALVTKMDPGGKFRNGYLERVLG